MTRLFIRSKAAPRAKQVQGIIILNYDRPVVFPPGSPEPYGAGLKRNGVKTNPVILSRVREAVKEFAKGLMQAEVCAGLGIPVPARFTPNITIAVGTTNTFILDYSERYQIRNPALGYDHGVAWAKMVKDINASLRIYPGISVAAAFDAEPLWWLFDSNLDGKLDDNNPQPTIDWAKGYDSNSEGLPYYLFASLDGAPRDDSWQGTTNQTFEVFYKLSTEIKTGRSLPQIYSWLYAKEWYQFKRYVAAKKGDTVKIAGVLSSYVDKQDGNFATWPEFNPYVGTKEGEYLTPNASWQALYDVLNRSFESAYSLPSSVTLAKPQRVAPGTQIDVSRSRPPACTQNAATFLRMEALFQRGRVILKIHFFPRTPR